jgi:pimeloyl-ACP methyl ester carboxylesterase
MNNLRTLSFLVLFSFHFSALAAELQKHEIMADGHPLTLWEKTGHSPAKTILLLHGRTYSSLPDFDLITAQENLSFMDALIARGFQVYALDARGYGATPRDVTGWLTPERAVRDVEIVLKWIAEETDETPHLYGWSYGSMVAQLVGQREPELIASLSLFGYPFDPDRYDLSLDAAYPNLPPRAPNTPSHAASDFITPGSISQEAIDTYVDVALKADPMRVDFKNLHEWAALKPEEVTVPTLLLQGEFDPIAPDHVQQALFLNLGTKRKWWVVLEGGDHAALLETPRFEMVDAIATFTQYVESSTR